jgi:hypothetical protein
MHDNQEKSFDVYLYLCGSECFHGKYGACFGGVGAAGGSMEMGQIFPLR